MPLYDYKCQAHGVFHELTTVEDFQQPQACPTCGVLAARIIRLPPTLLTMPSHLRHAHATNEKARDKPIFSTTEQRNEDRQHASTCGCANKRPGAKMLFTAQGEKMFPSMRPWMISH